MAEEKDIFQRGEEAIMDDRLRILQNQMGQLTDTKLDKVNDMWKGINVAALTAAGPMTAFLTKMIDASKVMKPFEYVFKAMGNETAKKVANSVEDLFDLMQTETVQTAIETFATNFAKIVDSIVTGATALDGLNTKFQSLTSQMGVTQTAIDNFNKGVNFLKDLFWGGANEMERFATVLSTINTYWETMGNTWEDYWANFDWVAFWEGIGNSLMGGFG